MKSMDYAHVDVFASRRLQGNGLAVVFCDRMLSDTLMLNLAREFKQFETIFLLGYDGTTVRARIFTMEGELPFAGHPILGAVAALHERHAMDQKELRLRVLLEHKRSVAVVSTRTAEGFRVRMRQGRPVFSTQVTKKPELKWLASAHNLPLEALDADLPVEVVSTGLPYLLLPVREGLREARITVRDLEERIKAYGAAYTYLFDPVALEARTWDNLGLVEDSATGSAAGPVCAYLARHGRIQEGQSIEIHQGQYANDRPGIIEAVMENGEVYVSGDVVFFAKGSFMIG